MFSGAAYDVDFWNYYIFLSGAAYDVDFEMITMKNLCLQKVQ